MKRMFLLMLGLLMVAGAAMADPDDDYRGGPGRGWGGGPGYGMGPGMMGGGPGWGMGPGMMGGGAGYGMGPGMMGAWGDWDEYAQIPADKRAKLRDLSVETQKKMIGTMAAMHELMLTYRKALTQFPVDKALASKSWEGMDSLRKQMFDTQLDATAKAQDILGKELWEKLDSQRGYGRSPRGR